SALTITGQGAETTIIEPGAGAPAFRILNVAATGTLTLQKLTLRNSGSQAIFGVLNGGAIFNSGTLTLIDCILTRNFAGSRGGGLYNNTGTVTINRTTFDGNGAIGVGGGLSNGGGFPVNTEGGTVTIANSTFVHNLADGAGGLSNSN